MLTALRHAMLKYILISFGTFLVLALLKFVENSPIRSWKTVLFTSVPLAAVICYYVSCAWTKPVAPAPEQKKIANYRAEMERTIRRIAGVKSATINGSRIDIDFEGELPISEMRKIALQSGATAAYFMKPAGTNLTVLIHMTAIKRDRLEIEYDTTRGVIRENVFD